MQDGGIDPDIAAMSFEDALAQLEEIVKKLEQGKSSLDDAIESYRRGTALKQHCEAKLRAAEEKISVIELRPDGSVGTKRGDDVPF